MFALCPPAPVPATRPPACPLMQPTTVSLYDLDARRTVETLYDNAALSATLAERLLPTTEFFTFTPSYPDASSLNGYRTMPPGVSRSSPANSPVLIYVYGSAESGEGKGRAGV